MRLNYQLRHFRGLHFAHAASRNHAFLQHQHILCESEPHALPAREYRGAAAKLPCGARGRSRSRHVVDARRRGVPREEVQSWEALVATRPACSPSLYEPMQIRGEYELRAPPHLSVRVETAGAESTLVQTCEHAGVVCVHPEILHHAAVPWDAVTTLRMENTARAYLVHKLNAILTPAYDVSIMLNATRQVSLSFAFDSDLCKSKMQRFVRQTLAMKRPGFGIQ